MKDGVYQVHVGGACAGFVIRDGKLAECAPILRRTFHHWQRVAHYLGAELLKLQRLNQCQSAPNGSGRICRRVKHRGAASVLNSHPIKAVGKVSLKNPNFPCYIASNFLQYLCERPEMSSQRQEVTRGHTEKGNQMPQMSQRLLGAMSRQRNYQLRHKRAGLCHECSRPAASGTTFCELHRRKRNVENREIQRKKFKRRIRYRNAESYRFTGSNGHGV